MFLWAGGEWITQASMARSVPDSRVEQGPGSVPLETWQAESELGERRRRAGSSRTAALSEALRGAFRVLVGVLLAIGAPFAAILAAKQLEGWPHTRTVFVLLAVASGLMAVGAWLAFELSEAEGLGTSTEWDPASPP